MNPRELRQAREEFVKKINELEAKAKSENRSFTPEEDAQIDCWLEEITKKDREIERAERVAVMRAASARPVEAPENRSAAIVTDNLPPGQFLTDMIRSIAYSNVLRAAGQLRSAEDLARDHFRNAAVAKALSEGTANAGGYLVPQNFGQEYIDLLRNKTVLRRAGVTQIPLPNGNLKLPKGATGASAAYVGENATIAASQGTFSQLAFAAKKLAALVPMSNELLADSSPAAGNIVRQDLLLSASVAEDAGMIRSDGTGNSPTGILNQTNAANKFAAANATAPTVAQITADATKAFSLIEAANVPMEGLFWIMAPRVRWYIAGLRDGNGNLAFPGMAEMNPVFMGYPVQVTGQVPVSLGVGTNESEIYLCAAPQLIIADTATIEIAVSSDATYDSGGGTMVSAFANDQTVMRVISRHDFKMRYDKAAVVLTAVKWGA